MLSKHKDSVIFEIGKKQSYQFRLNVYPRIAYNA
jgi:hypothetical protein